MRIDSRLFRQTVSYLICLLIGVFLSLGSGQIHFWGILNPQPADAQFIRPERVSPFVYERYPDFPLENQYVRKETGEVDPESTLANRLISYHLYVKNRPPQYRLDWKLTLADYLGAHEKMSESSYPGSSTLTVNPLESDRQIIESLTRSQRNQLIDVLVGIFNPNTTNSPSPTPTPQPSPSPSPSPSRNPLSLPQPGDAQLLMP